MIRDEGKVGIAIGAANAVARLIPVPLAPMAIPTLFLIALTLRSSFLVLLLLFTYCKHPHGCPDATERCTYCRGVQDQRPNLLRGEERGHDETGDPGHDGA